MNLDYKKAQESYDKYAKLYAENTFHKLLQFQLNNFISHLPKGAKILDVACGSGRDTQYLTEDGFDVLGIDISEELLKEARLRAKNCKFQKMNLLRLEFDESSFDGIWCTNAVTVIPKDNISEAVKEIHRVLKKEGILYISVKEGHGQEIVARKEYENAPFYYSYLTKEELENLLKESNFQIISSEVSDAQGTKWVEIFAKKI